MESGWWFYTTILKNMKVNGKDDIPYMKWKIHLFCNNNGNNGTSNNM